MDNKELKEERNKRILDSLGEQIMRLLNIKTKKTKPLSTGVKGFYNSKTIWTTGHNNRCNCNGCNQANIKYLTKYGTNR